MKGLAGVEKLTQSQLPVHVPHADPWAPTIAASVQNFTAAENQPRIFAAGYNPP